jgi:hypothetical protein
MRKISDHLEKQAPENENENEKFINEILPMFTQLFEYENSQEFSSLAEKPQL